MRKSIKINKSLGKETLIENYVSTHPTLLKFINIYTQKIVFQMNEKCNFNPNIHERWQGKGLQKLQRYQYS
jgi:hypothetical protein